MFSFVITSEHVKEHLLNEVQALGNKLSFSLKIFLTFNGELSPLIFCFLQGIFIKKSKDLTEFPLINSYHVESDEYNIINNEKKLLVVLKNEYWLVEITTKNFNSLLYILKNKNHRSPAVISRAYFKVQEALYMANIKLSANDTVLDLGSAPGGASQYCLQQGAKVDGVDPAQMDESLNNNQLFYHYQSDLFSFVRTMEVKNYTLLLCDINLDAFTLLPHLITIWERCPQIKTCIWTVKGTKNFNAIFINDLIARANAKKYHIYHLPSHHCEVVFIIYKN
jgi:hypothetical protein